MYHGRIAVVEAAEDAAAATPGASTLVCPAFNAKLLVFEKFASANPTSGTLRKIQSENITVFNQSSSEIAAGDKVLVTQTVDETWVVVAPGGGGGVGTQVIGFEVPGEPYGNPTPQCWFLRISTYNDPSEIPGPPSELLPEGTTVLYEGKSFDDFTGGFAYYTQLWIFQTCQSGFDLAFWIENDEEITQWYLDNSLAGSPQEIQGSNTCSRDTHLTLIDEQLLQPTDYTVVDIVPLIDSDDCDPSQFCVELSPDHYERGRTIEVNVIARPCGVLKVPLESEEGMVTVKDTLGSFLYGRRLSEAAGRFGHAVLVYDVDDEESTCYWMITWLDWFEPLQVVSDVVIGQNGITIDRYEIDVWRKCKLPTEFVEGADCEDEESGN